MWFIIYDDVFFQDLRLLLLCDNHVTFWLVSDINTIDLIGLFEIQKLVGIHSFLTHQAHLFICPYLLGVFLLLLDFFLELLDYILQTFGISLGLLCRLQKEFSFTIKIDLHLVPLMNLFVNNLNKGLTQVLHVIYE